MVKTSADIYLFYTSQCRARVESEPVLQKKAQYSVQRSEKNMDA
jgi:hypothetical protein